MRKLGRNELLFELSAGGMGTVYVARQRGHAQFERLVVVKRVHAHLARDPEFRARLLEEGRLSSNVRHPNAVGALDVGEDDEELYLVFEYVESLSLSELSARARARSERLEPPVVSRIVSDVLAGLHAAHEARDVRGAPLDIVHRDVSPQNVIVGSDGSARLIDFGVAKARDHASSTRREVLVGKIRYMAPEQLLKKSLDRRSDLFACATVLFEALTGERLFDGEEAAVAMSILLGAETRLADARPALPSRVVPVLERALASLREERFSTAAELQQALESAIPPAPTRDVAAVVDRYGGVNIEKQRRRIREAAEALDRESSEDVTSAAVTAESAERPMPARSRRATGVLLGVAAAAVAAAAWLMVRANHGPATQPAPPTPSADPAPALAPAAAVGAPTTTVSGTAATAATAATAPAPVASAATAPLSRAKPRRAPKATSPLHKSPYDDK